MTKISINKILFFCVMFLMLFIPSIKAQALTYTGYTVYDTVPYTQTANPPIGSDGKTLREAYVDPGILHYLDMGDIVKYDDSLPNSVVASTSTKCASSYYRVSFYSNYNGKTYDGYVCGDYLTIQYNDVDAVKGDSYIQTLKDSGFTDAYASYWPYLLRLHNTHPNWKFVPISGGAWSTVVAEESTIGTSLVQSGNKGLYSIESNQYYDPNTDTYTPREGSDWFVANSQTVGYHVDPRNFLNEVSVFMFEYLKYSPYQDVETLKYIFDCPGSNSYLCNYINTFITTCSTPTDINGASYTISPLSMAARVKQETGIDNTITSYLTAINGLSFTYGSYTRNGVYNLFNIGAFADGVTSSPRVRGLAAAAGYLTINGSYSSFNRPWDTYEKAIAGGISFVKQEYVSNDQDTLYYQKFNVRADSPAIYHHQYMTNITAPNSEALTTYKAYKKSATISNNTEITFYIPVFTDMPSTTSLPPYGSQNNYLQNLTVNGTTVPNFDKYQIEYTIPVSTVTSNAVVGGTTINDKAKISGIGNINLNSDNQTITVTVTAENGTTRNYYIHVVKTDGILITPEEIVNNMSIKNNGVYMSGFTIGTSSSVIDAKAKSVSLSAVAKVYDATGKIKSDAPLVTGDTVSITNNSLTKDYKIVIYGDPNGDGSISILDLLKVQKHILQYSTLSGEYYAAADSNRDGKIDIIDLLQIQKHILGKALIEQ